MQTAHILQGLPGSGKSHYAKRLIAESREGIFRVNLDDIRTTMGLGQDHSRAAENVVKDIQDDMIRRILLQGRDVVIDNTHLNPNFPNRYRRKFNALARFKVHSLVDVPLGTCITRDGFRAKKVGPDVIKSMAAGFAKASRGGWALTDDYMNEFHYAIVPYVVPLGMPYALICDLDGTLARHVSRSPYEPFYDVLNMLAEVRNERIILLSGRESAPGVRDLTLNWLDRHQVPFDELHMREAGDNRPDDIVKLEIFNRKIRDRFSITKVLDDRNRVVDLWRSLGLRAWQVKDGDF